MQRSSEFRGVAPTLLGFGGAQLGNLYRETSDDDAAAAIDAAWDRGVRYFDTAPHYGLGLSERRIGAGLAGRPRGEYGRSTKVGKMLDPSPSTADRMDEQGFAGPARFRRRFDFSADAVLRSVDESLGRLGTDYLDIAFLHDPDDHWESASTTGIGALVELREQGVVKAIGAGMNQSEMLTQFVRATDVDVVMVAGRYSLLDQRAQDDLLPAAAERGVAVVDAGIYNSGLLSRDSVPDTAKYDYADAPPELIERARRIAAVCEAHGTTLPIAATQFPLRNPAVACVVIGLRNADQVRSAVERLTASVPGDLWTDLAAEGLVRL